MSNTLMSEQQRRKLAEALEKVKENDKRSGR